MVHSPEAGGALAGWLFRRFINEEELTLEQASLIQAAAVIAGGMAGAQYGKYSVLEASRITDIASLAVELARAIETEAKKQS